MMPTAQEEGRAAATARYTERRMLQLDDAEARINALAAMNARRYMAIRHAAHDLTALVESCKQSPRLARELKRIIAGLEQGNAQRAEDERR